MKLPSSAVPLDVRRLTGGRGDERGAGLTIKWSTGEMCILNSRLLRHRCPCADCRTGKAAHGAGFGAAGPLRVLPPGEQAREDLREVRTVGNYALNLTWGDGHDTGIYTFELLRDLTEEAAAGS